MTKEGSDGGDKPSSAERTSARGSELFLGYDQQRMVDRFNLECDDLFLYVAYLGDEYRIDRSDGTVEIAAGDSGWATFEDYHPKLVIYDMLCRFQDSEDDPQLAGEFCSTYSLTVAAQNSSTKNFNQAFANAFAGHADELAEACERIGGELQPRMARADLTYIIPVFRWFNTIFQFWDGDEEFAPKVMFLWDRNSLKFMRLESLHYVTRGIWEKMGKGYSADFGPAEEA